MPAYFPYDEPAITTLLIQSSFLFLLNAINWSLNKILYCGLIGQVLLGIAWGTPGAKLLPSSTEDVFVQLGYLGLLMVIYEGGLAVPFSSLRANILLSSLVAVTGITLPIGLSFLLPYFTTETTTPLQAFAAGAALCSTSLGTTFTVLGTSGLGNTRMGVILTSAAMMDDVVGLVMVQVISNLGGDRLTLTSTTTTTTAAESDGVPAAVIVRPILVSVAFVVVLLVFCRYLLLPTTVFLNRRREAHRGGKVDKLLRREEMALVLHTMLLLCLVTGASYAGTSNLFAAYLAGAIISWWDSEVPHLEISLENSDANESCRTQEVPDGMAASVSALVEPRTETTGLAIYHKYYQGGVEGILKPFFFASIGFSIPISEMFTGSLVWRGIIYSILMAFGKMLCGLWLVRFSSFPKILSREKIPSVIRTIPILKRCVRSSKENPPPPSPGNDVALSRPASRHRRRQLRESTRAPSPAPANTSRRRTSKTTTATPTTTTPEPEKPKSLYPGAIVSCAMVARGEIGFLISSIAQSRGIFDGSASPASASSSTSSQVFLIVTWAIFLCTIVGPLGVGLLVRRVRQLERESRTRNEQEGLRRVLGVWM